MIILYSKLEGNGRAPNTHIHKQADGWTDERYQVHYLTASLKLRGYKREHRIYTLRRCGFISNNETL